MESSWFKKDLIMEWVMSSVDDCGFCTRNRFKKKDRLYVPKYWNCKAIPL